MLLTSFAHAVLGTRMYANISNDSLNQLHILYILIILLRSASSGNVRHIRFFISIWSYLLHPPPSVQPLPCPLWLHPFRPSPFPLSWQFHLQHPSPIYPSLFLRTCPIHLSLASRVFSPDRPTCGVILMSSFLIFSILFTAIIDHI